MDIDLQFARLNGEIKDVIHWKNHLLRNEVFSTEEENAVKDIYRICLSNDTITYDDIKFIELIITKWADFSKIFVTAAKRLNEVIVSSAAYAIFLDILLKIKSEKPEQLNLSEILAVKKFKEEPEVEIRIACLSGAADMSVLMEDDDLVARYLLHYTKNFKQDFEEFCELISYDTTVLLDCMLYDSEEANYLKILIKVTKVQSWSKDFVDFIKKFVKLLTKVKNSFPYNTTHLIKTLTALT